MGIHAPTGLLYRFRPEVFVELVECIATEANHARTRKLERKFDALYGRLAAISEGLVQEEPDDDDTGKAEFLSQLPPHIRDAVSGILDDPRLTSVDQVNAALEAVVQAHNRAPVAQFAGLSPEQLYRLTSSPWDDPKAAFYIRDDLRIEEVADTEMFRNARIMLRALGDEGVPATKGGSFSTKFVARMADEMDYRGLETEHVLSRRTFEDDFTLIPDLRHLLTYAGLMRKHGGRFKRTKKAVKLLDDANAGALYALLFRTMFHDFDLGYPFYSDEFLALQWALPFPVYVLGAYAHDWQNVERFAPTLLLITVVPYIDESRYIYRPQTLAEQFILNPLAAFGAIEGRNPKHKEDLGSEIRITPLFHRVFSLKT